MPRRGAGFEGRLIAIPPGAQRAYDEAEWRDALVVIERGVIELESRSGLVCAFQPGDVLCLTGLRLRCLRNPGRVEALISSTSRPRLS